MKESQGFKVGSASPKVSFNWLSDSVILTFANLLAAAANYLFQALMRRHLSWSEFGYLNASLSLILFASVPLTAASQTLTHHLALLSSRGDTPKMVLIQAASLKVLRHFTWLLILLSLIFIYPVSDFLHYPRSSLVWTVLLLIPVNLWSALGGAWCSGLSRFRLLAFLMISAAVVRLSTGEIFVRLWPWAETGLFATMLSGLVLSTVVIISPHKAASAIVRSFLRDRKLMIYGLAALSVSFGTLAFLQGDQIIAQRHFSGETLGRYSGAGLLGRAIVWVGLPVLTVYFTRRSGRHPNHRSPVILIWVYLGLIIIGSLFLIMFRIQLLSLLLGVHDSELATMASQFALVMIPIGILQALGFHFLAARQILACLLFGTLGILYLIALTWWGTTPSLILETMGITAALATLLLGFLSWLQQSTLPPSA